MVLIREKINPHLQERLGIPPGEIAQLCQRWNITQLALFGSVLNDQFHDDSDIDLLISFAPNARQGLLTLAKIKYELEAKIGRKVDIVHKESIENSENWIRCNEILNHTQIIHTVFAKIPAGKLVSSNLISIKDTHRDC